MRRWWIGVVLASACAPALQSESRPPVDSVPVPSRAVRPVEAAPAFVAAVEWGTRTHSGEPGAAYWQQRASYRILAELDPARAQLQAEQTVSYRNASPDTLRRILVHLYQNAFREDATRTRATPITGGVQIQRVVIGGATAREGAPSAPSYRIDGTLMWVDLARPLLPGASVELAMAWSLTVPPAGAPRTGHADREAFVVAQWYPQVAVYDDLRGWHDVQYRTNGEFYQVYAEYDVALTLPEGWLVTATGELDNAEEVLPAPIRQRLARALAQDSIVRVVMADDLEQGAATSREPGGQLTWRFRARDVRDFAFATSNRYLWDATRALLPDTAGRDRPVLISALYRPAAVRWREAARYMRHALQFHAQRWGPYIYPHISAAEGPIDGMEYPMLVFIGAPADPVDLYAVLSHEIAHEWWPMMVGSNESLYAWQDEGLVTYVEDLSVRDYFPRTEPALATQEYYLRFAPAAARPIMTPPDAFGGGPEFGVAAYFKPGTLLRALGAVIGEAGLQEALRQYTHRWLLRHPAPEDFFSTVEAVAGTDLDWFWRPWFYETGTMDQAIAEVTVDTAATGERVSVIVEDRGTIAMPVRLALIMEDGTRRDVQLPVEPWLGGSRRQTATVEVAGRLIRVELDPERFFPDIDRGNNVWLRN